jgi:hypothetical protein
MRFRVLMAAALLAAIAQRSAATETWSPAEQPRENAVMLYFSKSFGADPRGNRQRLGFGLRLQHGRPLANAGRVDLLDFKFSGRLQARLLNGALQLDAFGSRNRDGKSSSEASSADPEDSSEKHRGKILTISLLGIVGAACAFQWGICESSDSREVIADPPGPDTPGPG